MDITKFLTQENIVYYDMVRDFTTNKANLRCFERIKEAVLESADIMLAKKSLDIKKLMITKEVPANESFENLEMTRVLINKTAETAEAVTVKGSNDGEDWKIIRTKEMADTQEYDSCVVTPYKFYKIEVSETYDGNFYVCHNNIFNLLAKVLTMLLCKEGKRAEGDIFHVRENDMKNMVSDILEHQFLVDIDGTGELNDEDEKQSGIFGRIEVYR